MPADGLPDDADGDALRRLRNDGADLNKPHSIDFHVAVPDEESGHVVLAAARELGFKVKLDKDEDGTDWTCYCTKTMVPDHASIVEVEATLDSIAKKVGGKADGWGAFPVM